MTSMPATTKLGASDYQLKFPYVHGPLGERWVVRSESTGAERVADIVAPGDDDFLRSICENALRTKNWTEHASVANVLEAGWLPDGQYFQVLDMSPQAYSLASTKPQVSETELLAAASAMQDGLMHMHKRELVHGALAPECIYRDGETVRIGDLWWAHNADGESLYGKLSHYMPGRLPDFAAPFMAPEVLLGESPKRESDIYSLGAVLFLLLTGEPPRDSPLPAEHEAYRSNLAKATVKPLAAMRPDISEQTCAVILRTLEEDPVERLSIFWLEAILQELTKPSQ